MTDEAIESYLHATPFRPFTLTTASGKSFRVPHPDYLTFGPGRRVALVYSSEEFFDAVDVAAITEIEHTGPRPEFRPPGVT